MSGVITEECAEPDSASSAAEHRLATRDTGWALGANPGSYVLGDVRVVLPNSVTARASVIVEDGRIVEVIEGSGLRADVSGAGMLLLPGLIDVHSDALEKERVPRTSAPLPLDFAMQSFDAKVAAAGITTIFHGAGFHRKISDGVSRLPSMALEVCQAIDVFVSDRVDHRVLHRFDVRGEEGAALIRGRMDGLPADAEPILLSHEDHTPGQGQYADIEHFIDMLVAGGENREDVERNVAARIAEGERTAPIRDKNLAWAGEQARLGRVRLIGHDPDTAEAIDALVERGGVVAEFPTTMEAARRARERGMVTVAGAPNVLRRGSHSGNVSAVELIAEGLVDALASDYLPSSLLTSAVLLARDGVVDLPSAVALVSSGAAAAAGLTDRGAITAGARADFVLVDDRGPWPTVVTTLTAPRGIEC